MARERPIALPRPRLGCLLPALPVVQSHRSRPTDNISEQLGDWTTRDGSGPRFETSAVVGCTVRNVEAAAISCYTAHKIRRPGHRRGASGRHRS